MRPYKTQFNFGKNLKKIRKRQGLTQSELANKIGLTLRAISYYETENKYPPAALLPEFSKHLSISLEELLGVKNIPELPRKGKIWRRLKEIEKMSPSKQKQVFDLIKLVKNQK